MIPMIPFILESCNHLPDRFVKHAENFQIYQFSAVFEGNASAYASLGSVIYKFTLLTISPNFHTFCAENYFSYCTATTSTSVDLQSSWHQFASGFDWYFFRSLDCFVRLVQSSAIRLGRDSVSDIEHFYLLRRPAILGYYD